MKIGAQMYTVRDFTRDLPSFSETLKKIADIGYTTVQVSGTCDYDGLWLNEELRKNGLSCVITHTNVDLISDSTEEVMKKHEIFGCKYIGIGGYNIAENGIETFVNKFFPAAQKMSKNAQLLMYHNHDGEFQHLPDGRLILDAITEDMPAELGITLDTFWVQAGGGDPIYWLHKLKGRTPCVHYKDMAYGRVMMPLGEGNMNFDGIIKASVDLGVEYALVEQDDCGNENPFDCLKRSYEFLKSRGLE